MSQHMTEEWVSLWYQCLCGNIDYFSYCTAKDSGDAVTCAELEAKFELLASIYDDFGDVDVWPADGMQSKSWQEWFEPRRHLFMCMPRVVDGRQGYETRSGYLLIEVPLLSDTVGVSTAVAELIEQQRSSATVESPKPPKYMLHECNGKPAHGIQQVRQACRSAERSYRYDPVTFEELKHLDNVAAFVRNEIDYMGWTLDPKAYAVLKQTGQLSEQRLESFKAMLNRCRRDFKSFAANAIRASFPNDRPFDSTVLDIF